MKGKLQEYALIAEILGGIAIVVSLIFVGFQITDGNRETRAATTQAVLEAEMLFQAQLLRYADVWEKVVIDGDMSDRVETRRGIALFNMMITQEENTYEMQKTGYIEYSEITFGQFAPNFLEAWRQSPGAKSRSPEFMQIVDDRLFPE